MGRTTFDFSGQVAVVTGGARGIGKGSAEAVAAPASSKDARRMELLQGGQ